MAKHTGTISSVVGVYVSFGENAKDFYHRLPVSTKSTASDVVKTVVATCFGKEANASQFALYEAEFLEQTTADICVALQDHVAQDDSQLAFMKGRRVTVLSKPSPDTWVGRDKRFARHAGRCVRMLEDSEVPLFVQYNWKSQAGGNSKTFVLMEREPEVQENATKEFYAKFAAPRLRALLQKLDAEEAQQIEEIRAKYDAQRAIYQGALQQAKAQQS